MTSKLWNIDTGQLVSSMSTDSIGTASAISRCGSFEITGLEDATCVIKDTPRDYFFKFITGHTKSISSIALSNCG